MPSVTYIEFNSTTHTVEVPVGTSLMRGALDNSIPGIDADCGGGAPAPPVTRMSTRRG
jgi:ferredoxin, 2Fe-2S